MIPIRFRIYDMHCKEMLISANLTIEISNNVLKSILYRKSDSCSFSSCGDYVRQDRYKLMQFTGLKDKTGRDIYEGDIIKIVNGNSAQTVEQRMIIDLFNFTKMDILKFYLNKPYRESIEICEIIGDIYTNPELAVTI